MSTQEYKVDRSQFGSGEWDSEPDKIEWRHEGLPCLIVRNDMGNLCGYVGVTREHPWYGVNYNDVSPCPEVHGGLAYSERSQFAVCHDPKEGESDDVWWLGFDCAHVDDLVPALEYVHQRYKLPEYTSPFPQFQRKATYRNIAYVTSQVNLLADQAVTSADILGSCPFESEHSWKDCPTNQFTTRTDKED